MVVKLKMPKFFFNKQDLNPSLFKANMHFHNMWQ